MSIAKKSRRAAFGVVSFSLGFILLVSVAPAEAALEELGAIEVSCPFEPDESAGGAGLGVLKVTHWQLVELRVWNDCSSAAFVYFNLRTVTGVKAYSLAIAPGTGVTTLKRGQLAHFGRNAPLLRGRFLGIGAGTGDAPDTPRMTFLGTIS